MNGKAWILIAAFLLFACESGEAPAGSDSPVVGKWAGRYQLADLGITINLLMQINPDHAYRVDATPNVAGLDTLRVYEEKGNWSIKGDLFIAAKTSCRSVGGPNDLALRDTLCPPPDTSVIDIVGDSAWAGTIRGQTMTLKRVE